jgi:GNAT superfamily N-acetyltransferase
MAEERVATATEAEIDECVALITLAFVTDPAVRWMYPDSQVYCANFPRFVKAFGGGAFAHGSAHLLKGSAAALWCPPGVEPDEEPLVALLQSTVPEGRLEMVFGVLEEMGRFHPEEPHWYLPLIGTDPVQQGKGHGSTLLRHALSICDAERIPAYIEGTSPRNVMLYRRHGFEVLGTVQVGTSPPITPMLRQPR